MPETDEEIVTATIAAIAPADAHARTAARAELDRKVKPVASLGRLEDLAARVAGIHASPAPPAPTPAVVVCAADHGIADEGVSAYPQAVTAQMLTTFATGGAAVCVLARQAGARLVVVDLGVLAPPNRGAWHAAALDRRVRAGTANTTREPAMTSGQALRAVRTGVDLARDLHADGVDLVAVGDMGIANTTTASAVTAALLGAAPEDVCGRGTGVDDDQLAHKVATVRPILARHRAVGPSPMDVLADLGGLEIAALTGVVLGCAAHRLPVVLDGFITGAAALVAARLAPHSVDAMIAGHRSTEPGHALQLADLGLDPLLDLAAAARRGQRRSVGDPPGQRGDRRSFRHGHLRQRRPVRPTAGPMTTAAHGSGRAHLVDAVKAAACALADAVTLLTRVSVPRRRPAGHIGDADVVRGAVCFPLVGAGIGLAVAGTATLCALWLPPAVAAVLAVSLEVTLTGALHLDGLGDSADGLAGTSRDHTLAIRGDHGVGVYGATAIGLDLLLKATALAALTGTGTVAPVVAAYALSRAAPLPLACLLDYPRAEGTGRAVVHGLTSRRAAAGIGIAVLVTAVAGWTATAMLAASALATLAVGLAAYRRIGGVTGTCSTRAWS